MPACELCGSVRSEVAICVGEHRVVRCSGCGLGQLDPRPKPASLSDLYGEDYFSQHRMTADTDDQLRARVAGQDYLVRFIRRWRRAGSLLDIGCASGYFPARARETGYEVCGLEIAEWAVRQGQERLGLNIHQGTIGSASFDPASFDIITMWHVVEHLDEPISDLTTVRNWLKPDGVLVVACPNAGSFDAKKYGVEWAGWSIPYHIWHFTPKSLGMLLTGCGYEALHLKTTNSQWIKERLRRLPVLTIVRNLVSSRFTGRDMWVVARLAKGC